jgi:TPR repeat protein
MHSLLTLQTHLLLFSILTAGISGDLHAQPAPEALTKGSFELMEQKWALVPADELLKATQDNDPQAQFFYWVKETDRAMQEQNQLWNRWVALSRTLPQDEQNKLWDKWKSATDEEVKQAAERGEVEAKIVLDCRKSNAAGGRAVDLFRFLEKSADQGFLPAESKAALYYLNLGGYRLTDVNQPKGLALLCRSADRGWSSSQYQLAAIYLQGELLPPDIAKAVEYFQKAADQDGPRSQYELAKLYANGCGVPRSSDDEPIALLRQAAAKNNVPALHELGERYRIGLGVALDYVQAACCYQRAWQASRTTGYDPDRLGEAIFSLVEPNLTPKPGLTRELAPFANVAGVYLKATTRHDAASMSQIGEWYFNGRFAPKDMVEALRWFHLAEDFGEGNARKRVDEIKARLSPEQLKQALQPPKIN